jgi:transcriptional regulator with XRE-family HTH domain
MTSPLGPTTPTCQRWTTTLDGHRLRRLRHQRGLTQTDLALQAGISLTAIARLERQPHASCRPRTLTRLAAALGEPRASLTPTQQTSPPTR